MQTKGGASSTGSAQSVGNSLELYSDLCLKMATLDLEAVNVLSDSPEGPLPLKIRAKGDNNSVVFLKEWVATNKDWLDQKLLEHGSH